MIDLVEKWKVTGLLEGIASTERKEVISKLLEESSKYLIRISGTRTISEQAAGVVLPAVRRVYGSNGYEEFDIIDFCKFINLEVRKWKPKFNHYSKLDEEAEMTIYICEQYIKQERRKNGS